jgi:hypothetical protein
MVGAASVSDRVGELAAFEDAALDIANFAQRPADGGVAAQEADIEAGQAAVASAFWHHLLDGDVERLVQVFERYTAFVHDDFEVIVFKPNVLGVHVSPFQSRCCGNPKNRFFDEGATSNRKEAEPVLVQRPTVRLTSTSRLQTGGLVCVWRACSIGRGRVGETLGLSRKWLRIY